MTGKGDEYTCEHCKGTFLKSRSDEEARAETVANGFPLDDLVIVCDDCYRLVMGLDPRDG